MSVKVGNVVMFVSQDGETDWRPLEPSEVPAWLQKPDTLGAMIEGLLAHKDELGEPWYAAVTTPMPGQQPAPVIDLRKPRLILPKDAATLVPMGEAMNEDVALDIALQECGTTRGQMLGDAGNPVPMHPALEGGAGQSDSGGATETYEAAPSSSEPEAA